jgi:hypothetical protein
MTVLPRYPIYVPSKGRSHNPKTARFLMDDGVPFRMVVEPPERDLYQAIVGPDRILELDRVGGGLLYARNWIKDHATREGHKRHWQLDDNMGGTMRAYRGHRLPCDSGPALRAAEDFVDRYTNVAVAGLNYDTFVTRVVPPFVRNVHVYSCSLVLNSIPHRWRLAYNDDTDLCLQVLADGWCTILFNAFSVKKARTMTVKGGNTDHLYQGDGRLVMSRTLERVWPGVVATGRRYGRPQHVVKHAWKRFDTPLILRHDVDLTTLAAVNEYGMGLHEQRPCRDKLLRDVVDDYQERHG